MSLPAGEADPERTADLRRRLAEVRERIDRACRAAGRSSDEVTLVVVTKHFPASDIVRLAGLGVQHVAENRDQEARSKLADLADVDPTVRQGLIVHFVGQLQTNKASSVAGYADVVHSVDRSRLVDPLAAAATKRGRRIDVLLQVNLDPEQAGRGGVNPELLPELADRVRTQPTLRLRGLMAVAPLGRDAGEAFERLAHLHAVVRADHPDATWLSAGMSGDLEAAVAHGSTHLRVGTAILGSRPPLG
ncbi:MAG TPA: YggS family pyridoxal phosphate-dependent enzyme [Dermatophilaceae bacterium]|nr:YggS family pyridoxal phosphate-dependent enzyme [Dermatophilaceae bacterium]